MLTDAQLTTLGNHIRGNADVNGDLTNLGDIRDAYNAPVSGVYVFRTSVPTDDARKAIDWTEVLSDSTPLGDVERWAFDSLLANGDFNPTLESNRTALATIFSGSNYANTRAAILAEATRQPTLAESLYIVNATGPAGGNGASQANAAALVFQGAVTTSDVDRALELTE